MGLGNITFGGNNVRFGNDADKSTSPNPGDEYIAIDTGKKYICYNEGVWTDLNNVRFGNDADKPTAPDPGDEYIALDTRKKYVCYSAGVWTHLKTEITELITLNAIPGEDTKLINDLTEYSKSGYGVYGEYLTIKSYTIENISGLSNILGFNCQYQYRSTDYETRSRILFNGESVWTSGSTTSETYQTVNVDITETLKIGDIIEFQVWGANNGYVRYVQNIKISIGYSIIGNGKITTS